MSKLKGKEAKSTTKTSCKGSQQMRNELRKEHFLNVLNTQQPHSVENAGFIKDSTKHISRKR